MKDPVRNLKLALYPLGDVTQWFGENPELYQSKVRIKQNDGSVYILQGHSGIDIVRPHGEHIYAVEGGIVTKAVNNPTGYGKYVSVLTDEDEKGVQREWVYAHLSYLGVKEGQRLAEGQFLGKMGNTGFVVSDASANGFWGHNPYAGTHLHLGCRDRKNGRVLNYNNGYFGRYDIKPLLRPPHLTSSTILDIASRTQKLVVLQLALLLRKIGL